ncbi:MAG TPA: class I SAM-dependent methyltransferase [Dehalococcoidia bacterium]|nr:class I SAM-dependent methyltransferase [Dehalococcoidia bacterium]
MPSIDALKGLFPNGYNSGNVLARIPSPRRLIEEIRCGASYREVFLKGVAPYLRPDSRVMELGPGNGSWTRPILERVPQGEVHAVDFHDVSKWIKPQPGGGKLVCYQVTDNSFAALPDDYFDFFFSFGVLCHNNPEHRREILHNSLGKMKPGGIAVHMIGDWAKLEKLGWGFRYGVPPKFKQMQDDQIWWPRNDAKSMCEAAEKEGWDVVQTDLGLIRRDSMVVLKRPGA